MPKAKLILKGKRALVVGLGKSGVAAARLLHSLGADVDVTDDKPAAALGDILAGLGVAIPYLPPAQAAEQRFHLCVVSPGVPARHAILQSLRRRGVPIYPEFEFAWSLTRPRATLAVTGTNGKTTTTALLEHLLRSAGKRVLAGGNIGTPVSDLVSKISPSTYVVLELSSYQLESHRRFHPAVALGLNLTPDHLGRHGSLAAYGAAKARLFENMTRRDTAVLNRDDAWCRRVAKSLSATVRWFPDASLEGLAAPLPLVGRHNQENGMAAAAAALAVGVPEEKIRAALKTFKGVPHRIQFTRERKGVRFYNDSKSTNVDSTLVALRSFHQRLILILGGQHKGAPYTPLAPLIKSHVDEILTIGEAAPIIAKDLKRAAPVRPCGTLEKAVAYAAKRAKPGQVVLLSPACASFDQFRNFEHRGERFAQLVKGLS
jgi:UDP-N-acetylmuramoylalanine--D-glutamate ligase